MNNETLLFGSCRAIGTRQYLLRRTVSPGARSVSFVVSRAIPLLFTCQSLHPIRDPSSQRLQRLFLRRSQVQVAVPRVPHISDHGVRPKRLGRGDLRVHCQQGILVQLLHSDLAASRSSYSLKRGILRQQLVVRRGHPLEN